MRAAAHPEIESATPIFDRALGLRTVTINSTECNAGASAGLCWSFKAQSRVLAYGLAYWLNITASRNCRMSVGLSPMSDAINALWFPQTNAGFHRGH